MRAPIRRPPQSPGKRQKGFLLLEVIIGLAVVASITAAVASQKLIDDAEATVAEGAGKYLDNLREALALYQQTYFKELEDGTAIPGFANQLKPTIAELKAKGYLNGAYPDRGPGGFTALVTGSRVNCPSPPGNPTCRIGFVISTPTSFTMPRTGNKPRYDLAVTAVQATRGTGGMTFSTDPARLRGATFNVDNPIPGNPGAVVATATFLDSAFWNQFVRMNDYRDPNLQGNLTVRNNLEIQGTTLLKKDTKIEGILTVNKDVGAGNNGTCNRAEMLADGRVISRSDCTDQNRIAVDPNVGDINIRRAGVDRVKIATPGNAGNIKLANASGTDTIELDAAGRRVKTSLVNLDGAITGQVGTACSQNGDIVRDSSGEGTSLFCRNGTWVMNGRIATPGGSCSFEGSTGTDPGTQSEYICRRDNPSAQPTWKKLNDRITRSVLIGRYYGRHGDFISRPSGSECPAPGSASILVVPAETATDYALQPPRSRYVASAVPTGAGWTLSLVLSDGINAHSNSFGGTPYNLSAFALVHCDYAN